jgi:hypothetical protein
MGTAWLAGGGVPIMHCTFDVPHLAFLPPAGLFRGLLLIRWHKYGLFITYLAAINPKTTLHVRIDLLPSLAQPSFSACRLPVMLLLVVCYKPLSPPPFNGRFSSDLSTPYGLYNNV